MFELDPTHAQEQERKNALAKEIANKRENLLKARQRIIEVIGVLWSWTKYAVQLFLVCGFFALLGTFLTFNSKPYKYVVDTRSCNIELGDSEIKGYRKYNTYQKDLFTYTIIDKTRTVEETFLNSTGTALTVVSTTDKKSMEITNIGQTGELNNNRPIPNADVYLFVLGEGKKSASKTVAYKDLCH